MKRAFNAAYVAYGVMALYRVLALVGVVALLDWTRAHDIVRGAAVMAALWAMAVTTDLRRGA